MPPSLLVAALRPPRWRGLSGEAAPLRSPLLVVLLGAEGHHRNNSQERMPTVVLSFNRGKARSPEQVLLPPRNKARSRSLEARRHLYMMCSGKVSRFSSRWPRYRP